MIWISRVPEDKVASRTRDADGPLKGLTFAVKDNIDVEGLPTTAGCPAYAYLPTKSATVVTRLEEAGAVLVGKTNMDQFATGLVGTRTPYGACSSVFNDEYISGGSSSGSAVVVARELVSFSLGTDTAGSGRVPAAFNGIVGLKPTRGLVSAFGVVPACRTLDCVSIFTRTCEEARLISRVAYGYDATDPFSIPGTPGDEASPWLGPGFRFGCPSQELLEFFGDDAASDLFQQSTLRLEALGGQRTEIDFKPFRAAAELLYSGPWVAERYAAIRSFIEQKAADMDPVVRQIIEGAKRYGAVDVFQSMYRLSELRRETEAQWARMDVLALPTTGTIYKHAEIAADPVRLNTNLGYYTNFVNLLDLAAIAVPAGLRPNGLPFGISLIGRVQ
ncbi:MAG: allophanate hydrolase [Bryobacteraceae bacterium]